MERQNEKQRLKKKADERTTIKRLYEMAYKHDPRMKKRRIQLEEEKKLKQEQKEREKLQKILEKQRQEEEERKKQEDEMRIKKEKVRKTNILEVITFRN